MKGKRGLYILLPAVIVLWGYIGYKIYTQIITPVQEIAEPQFKSIDFRSKSEKEVFDLDLKYSDPFLKQVAGSKEKKEKNEASKSKKRTWMWPQIVYKGCIENHKKTVGLLRFDNREYLVQKGMLVKEFQVKSVSKDSLVMEREGERRRFSKIN
ncbi:hypothetical protein [Marinifilum fragile]|uniref:hypothetical protein n=1 Tax=Marinifilum fragile TaxID=570161 RepID=UPI002AAA6BC1|nr:hypothetical protein [Marinifilum fragile]